MLTFSFTVCHYERVHEVHFASVYLCTVDKHFSLSLLLISPSLSPKPKPEVMVRSPPVMSPSGGAMDSKLPNQSKPGSGGSQLQASPCDLKTVGAKGSQQGGVLGTGPGGMGGLKNGQGLTSGGQGSKVKVKRERSTSVESYNEQQPDTVTPTSDDKGDYYTALQIVFSSNMSS